MSNMQTPEERRALLRTVQNALLEQNYDPIRQITGYLITEDPTYIPDHKNARALIAGLDREELLADLLRLYLDAE